MKSAMLRSIAPLRTTRYRFKSTQSSPKEPTPTDKSTEKEEKPSEKKPLKQFMTEAEMKAKWAERFGGLETEEFEDNKPTGAFPNCSHTF
jgi:hypothetical protein